MQFHSFEFVSMTTPCVIQIYEGSYASANKCFEEIKKNTLYLEKKYNFYNEDSYLSKVINTRTKNKLKIDTQSAEVLKKVRDLSIGVNNYFDITMGTLKKCYKEGSIEKVEKSLEENIPYTGTNTWDINNRILTFTNNETKLDLGGVVKEFAVDEASLIIRKFGINSAIINFGGDIYVVGKKPDGSSFSIGVKNPENPKENLVIINLENQALTTSANYERKIHVENEEFSHILTNTKRQSDIISSTIVSDSTLKSGIFSTSFMISTDIGIPEELKVVLIDKDLRLHQNLQN